jgi:hypothetical protein
MTTRIFRTGSEPSGSSSSSASPPQEAFMKATNKAKFEALIKDDEA